jgi:arsenate reductase
MENVLFICVHNSARSQMAEAFLKKLSGERFHAESAGLEPGKLNPYVVSVMKEVGIDISGNRTKGVMEFLDRSEEFKYIVTVCDAAGRCPVFPGEHEDIHWDIPDPSIMTGIDDEILRQVRVVRDQVRERVEGFLRDHK